MTQHPLPKSQYIQSTDPKKAIVIHHTAGGHRPDYTVDAWTQDSQRVATAFVIGGKSIVNGDTQFDGEVYQCYDAKYYAFHLGVKGHPNLEKQSIGIEVCNYGWLRPANGKFFNYVNKPVPADQVTDLGHEWRGYRYWHSYTPAQIQSLKQLLQMLSVQFKIPIRKAWNVLSFGYNSSAVAGAGGLWTHANYRKDKTDMYPHPALVAMLNTL